MAILKVQRVATELMFSGIEKIREEIKAGNIFPGDQIVITMDGHDTIWDVIGKDCEELVNPEFTHSITIQLHGLLEERSFDETGDWGSNVWESSDIREYLNGEEFAARFADIVPYLSKVRKGNSNGKQTEDLFFLLSKEEYTPGKTPYPYYEDIRNRVKFSDEGYSDWHWTRSAFRGYAGSAWNVHSSGYVSSSTASSAHRFSPACVIGV